MQALDVAARVGAKAALAEAVLDTMRARYLACVKRDHLACAANKTITLKIPQEELPIVEK